MTQITITKPDDWHLHLRDGAMLNLVAPLSHDFERAIIMPNLVPPVVNVQMAENYRERIVKAGFANPLMTLYLTEETKITDIEAAHASPHIHAVKLYPAGATTNSSSGVRDIQKVMPILEKMAELGLVLCVHGEVTDHEIDIFDREATFIDKILDPIRRQIPNLRVVMEHITTKNGVDYALSQNDNLGATITTHHLILDRNDLLVGGVKPHFYCLPIVKRREHREALRKAATSGDKRFFLGTDSAPHPKDKKECECCAAGVFSAPVTMGWLAQVFEEENALDQLEGFSSLRGPEFYRLPVNSSKITLKKQNSPVDFEKTYRNEDQIVTVFDPAQPLYWQVLKSE